MLKKAYITNLIFTGITTLLSLLFYGLVLAIPLGLLQLLYFIIVISKKEINKSSVSIHLKVYGVLALADLLLFVLSIFSNTEIVIFTPIVGLLLAWYHVWISFKVYKSS